MQIHSLKVASALLCLVVVSFGVASCNGGESATTIRAREAAAAIRANPDDQVALDNYVATLAEAPPGSGHYLVEGDILLTRNQIPGFLRALQAGPPPGEKELVVNVVGNRLDYLATPQSRRLTYMVDAASFRDMSELNATLAAMQVATRDWVNACPECGISFTEVAPADVAAGRVRPILASCATVIWPTGRLRVPSFRHGRTTIASSKYFPGSFRATWASTGPA